METPDTARAVIEAMSKPCDQPTANEIAKRVRACDWQEIGAGLDQFGATRFGPLLTSDECNRIAALFDGEETAFRSHVIMARHGFGRGEYKYWDYPLPGVVARLREALYPPLATFANRWRAALGYEQDFPAQHAAYLARCQRAGQSKPTPLLLRYREGDYNCLHQDLYGEHVFPLQVAILLSAPGRDFSGGEFVITEQRPRMQSRAEVVSLQQGEAVVFAVNARPVAGTRGTYRVKLRHGVSRLHSGLRHTLGIIFHDAG